MTKAERQAEKNRQKMADQKNRKSKNPLMEVRLLLISFSTPIHIRTTVLHQYIGTYLAKIILLLLNFLYNHIFLPMPAACTSLSTSQLLFIYIHYSITMITLSHSGDEGISARDSGHQDEGGAAAVRGHDRQSRWQGCCCCCVRCQAEEES